MKRARTPVVTPVTLYSTRGSMKRPAVRWTLIEILVMDHGDLEKTGPHATPHETRQSREGSALRSSRDEAGSRALPHTHKAHTHVTL